MKASLLSESTFADSFMFSRELTPAALEAVELQIGSDEYASELARAIAGFGSYDAALFALRMNIVYQFSRDVRSTPSQSAYPSRRHLISRLHRVYQVAKCVRVTL